MKNSLLYKLNKLKRILKQMRSVLIAYSGGVDSSLLLAVARDTLGNRVIAVTGVSETYPQQELIQAKKMAKGLQVKHLMVKTHELADPKFKQNPLNRCYYCKSELFTKLKVIARKNKINYILDGTNSDDAKDFRPGAKALEEFGVYSPLKEAGLKKDDIRILSKKLGLVSWDKPALACLASRFPYGMTITRGALQKIDRAERFIRSLGFRQVRVRHYDSLARIEVEKKEIPKLVTRYPLPVTRYLKKLDYTYVTVDLEGYRTGSMNKMLKEAT